MRQIVLALAVTSAISSRARAQETQPSAAAPVAVAMPGAPAVRWYGWQNLLAETVLAGIGSGIVHATHGYRGRAALAIGVRFAILVPTIVGLSMSFRAGAHDHDNDDLYFGMMVGGIAAYAAFSVYDIGYLAVEPVPGRPGQVRSGRGPGVAPSIFAAQDRLAVGLVGSF